jgi:hypothetical protein
VVKSPPTSWFLKKCAGIENGSKRPGHDLVGKVHVKHIYEIAKAKQADEHLKSISLEALSRSVMGSCLSMGLMVVSGNDQGQAAKAASTTIASVGKKKSKGAANSSADEEVDDETDSK